MTAEEFINKNSYFILNADTPMGNTLKEAMVEFAKYHVEQALKAASEDVKYREQLTMQGVQRTFSTNSILNCYPLEKIK